MLPMEQMVFRVNNHSLPYVNINGTRVEKIRYILQNRTYRGMTSYDSPADLFYV